MRYSSLFGKSTRDVSAAVSPEGNRLLVQAGYIRESSSGRYFLLPLALKVRDTICSIIEEEMSRIGGQKMVSPSLHPLELWEESGRSNAVSFELMQLADRRGRHFALGGTAEEMIVDVVRSFSLSYRDLPFMIYQFSSKFRDELRARGGLLRTREFLMKDGYSFHESESEFTDYYETVKEAYQRIFERLSIPAHMVAADNGYMGGEYCHEFIVDADCGESDYFITTDNSSGVHHDIAQVAYQHCNAEEPLLEMKIQEAKRGVTIDDGVKLYGMPAWRQIKTLVYIQDEQTPILVALRGDRNVHEIKLKRVLACHELRAATESEVEELGSVIGFVSPLKIQAKLVGDYSLQTVHNFYTGADAYQQDTLNVNYGRDFEADILADVTEARAGDLSVADGLPYRQKRGVEVGNIFQLGTHYSDVMQHASFVNEQGERCPFYMGCYGIGVDRVLATIAECHHDSRGLCWPAQLAPFQVHLISLFEQGAQDAEACYAAFQEAGVSVLFDDRPVSAGVKFADADLLGMPYRVLVSSRSVKEGGLEFKLRCEEEKSILPMTAVLSRLKESV